MSTDTTTIIVDAAGAKPVLTKQPGDTFVYTFDFTAWLADSVATISSATIVCAPSSVDLGPPTVGAVTTSSYKAQALISVGRNGYVGNVTCVATLSDGRKKEADFTLQIKDY